MKQLLLSLLLMGCLGLNAQEKSTVNIEKLTREFYTALNAGDSARVSTFFHSNCMLKHLADDRVEEVSIQQFLGICKVFGTGKYSEKIGDLKVHSYSSGLHYVDVLYEFYVDGEYSHSGMDHFCWSNRYGMFRIETALNTEFKSGSDSVVENDNDTEKMNAFMDKWHRDVADSDYDSYFGFMSDRFIFLGTDPSERWTKDEFAGFCKPYFDKKSTWDFKPNWRNWYFSEDGKTAWFEESIDTWMEECRGSGVLELTSNGWKISHYNLAVLIENEKIKKFIKLRQK